jgi:prevent-host-death family protein
MNEMHVSATDFRVHLKEWLNQAAEGGAPVVVVRHGFNMGVMIGLQEYRDFQEWKRRKSGEVLAPDEYPDNMPLEEIERIYRETAPSTDERTMRWRGRAYVTFKARTGKYLDGEPPS